MLTFAWFLAAGMKWSSEAIGSYSSYMHLISWILPAVKTTIIISTSSVDGDSFLGVCGVGNTNINNLHIFILAPLGKSFNSSARLFIYFYLYSDWILKNIFSGISISWLPVSYRRFRLIIAYQKYNKGTWWNATSKETWKTYCQGKNGFLAGIPRGSFSVMTFSLIKTFRFLYFRCCIWFQQVSELHAISTNLNFATSGSTISTVLIVAPNSHTFLIT